MIFRNEYNKNQNFYSSGPVRDDRNVNIEISYDNFDTVNLDLAKKQRYGQDLRSQMEENERKRKEAKEKKKLEDLEEELRLKRERELIEQRMNEENKRYRPQINLPIQKTNIEVKEPKKKEENIVITENKNTISEDLLNYLRLRENQIDDFNDKMMKNLQLINKEYQYNIDSLRGQIDILNGIHIDNQKNKDKFCKEVYDIRDDLYNRKAQNRIDANHLYDIVAKSNYANQTLRRSVGSVPRRKFDIKSYTTNKIYYADDERKGDGLTIPPYINFSHDVYNSGPRWRNNESVWWYY